MRVIRKYLLTLLLFLIVSRLSFSLDLSTLTSNCVGNLGDSVISCFDTNTSSSLNYHLVVSYTANRYDSEYISFYNCSDVTSQFTFELSTDLSGNYYWNATDGQVVITPPYFYFNSFYEASDILVFEYADLSNSSSFTVYQCSNGYIVDYSVTYYKYAYFDSENCPSSDILSVAGETYTLVEQYTGSATYIVGAICVAPDTLVKYCNDSLQICYNPDTQEVSRIVYVLVLDVTSDNSFALFCKYEVSADVTQLDTLMNSCSTLGGTLDGGTLDGGTLDGGTLDGGTLDGGTLDGGTLDGGTVDTTVDFTSVINAIEQNSMYIEDSIYSLQSTVNSVSTQLSSQISSVQSSIDSLHADVNNALYVDVAYSDAINSHVNSVLSGGFDTNIDGIPEKSDISSILYNFLSNSPVSQVFQNARIEVSSTVCSIEIPIQLFSASSVSNIDFCRFQDVLSLLGSFILVFSHLYAFYIVFKKD